MWRNRAETSNKAQPGRGLASICDAVSARFRPIYGANFSLGTPVSPVGRSLLAKCGEIAPRQGTKHSQAGAWRAFVTQYRRDFGLFMERTFHSGHQCPQSEDPCLLNVAKSRRDKEQSTARPGPGEHL